MSSPKNCLNCSQELSATIVFCPSCGQKTSSGRLNIRHIFHDIIHAFLHADSSIFRLFIDLIKKPGVIIREYVEGKRKKYFNPFAYLVLVVGLATLAVTKFGILNFSARGVRNPVSDFMNQHYNLIIFLSMPFLAFFTWLMFRKRGLNFAESLVFATYLSGERAVLFTFTIAPALYFFPGLYGYVLGIYIFLWCSYYGWAAMQFYQQKTFKTFILGFLVTVFTQILTTAVITTAIVFYFRSLGISPSK
jgi:hypothetical protein